MRRMALLSILGSLLVTACGDGGGGVITEPVTKADYFVANDTDQPICPAAVSPFDDRDVVELLADEVPANSEVKIFSAVEGSGGHARPSNFFGEFTIVSCADDSVTLYEGVEDSDWVERSGEPPQLVLTVAP